jgi:hypothetical protein
MKEKKVISYRNIPRRPPINITLIAALVCKVFEAPGWLWGGMGAIVLLFWLIYVAKVATEKEISVDLFEEKSDEPVEGAKTVSYGRSRWQDRLQEQQQLNKNRG